MPTASSAPSAYQARRNPVAVRILPPPAVPAWWTALSWSVFLLGSVMVLVGVSVFLFRWLLPASVAAHGLFVTTAAALVLGTCNTLAAGLGFSARMRAIQHWVFTSKARMEDGTSTPDETRSDRTADDSIRLSVEGNGRAEITATGNAISGSMRGSAGYARYMIGQYLEELETERAAPRQACARMAGALGGMFIVSLETLSALASRLGP
jgi:hypothetical protein